MCTISKANAPRGLKRYMAESFAQLYSKRPKPNGFPGWSGSDGRNSTDLSSRIPTALGVPLVHVTVKTMVFSQEPVLEGTPMWRNTQDHDQGLKLRGAVS